MDLYSHVMPGMHDEAAKTLDDAFNAGYNEKSDERTTDCQ